MERLRGWLENHHDRPTGDDATYLSESFEFHSIVSGMSGNMVLDLITLAMKDVFTSRVKSAVYPPTPAGGACRARGDRPTCPRRRRRRRRAPDARALEEYVRYATRRLPGLLEDKSPGSSSPAVSPALDATMRRI